jgi:hypothetical protein
VAKSICLYYVTADKNLVIEKQKLVASSQLSITVLGLGCWMVLPLPNELVQQKMAVTRRGIGFPR